jgi:hypothetical protein
MSAEAIYRITSAISARLQQALGAAGLPGTVFVGPLDDPDAQGASLVLFLYRVVPSSSLRNTEHRVPSATPPPPFVVYRRALPLDLYFLLTVGTTPGASEELLLRKLGVAMQCLNDAPDFAGAEVLHEIVHVTLEPLTTEETSRIWALFPTANYRTSVAYAASPVWIDPRDPPVVGAPVLHDRPLVAQRERAELP